MFSIPAAEPLAGQSVWHAAETFVKLCASVAGSVAGAAAVVAAVVFAGRKLPAACAAAGAGPG